MIIVDSGFFIALLDRKDVHHGRAKEILRELDEPIITTMAIITEVSYVVLLRLGWPVLVRFLKSLEDGFCHLFDVRFDHLGRIATVVRKYRDLPADFADASLILLAEELGHGRILTTDQRDFGTYRWKERKPFVNLLFDNSCTEHNK